MGKGNTTRGRCVRTGSGLTAVLTLGLLASAAWAQPLSATFEVRIAPTESDAVLDLNDPTDQVLDLDLFVTIAGAPPPVDLLGVSIFLQPSADQVVSFNTASFVNLLSGDPAHEQGDDNDPVSGAFSRGVGFLPDTTLGVGETKLAGFSVRAVGPGTLVYQFLEAGHIRPWRMDFYDFSTATVVAGPALTIQVVPEPGSLIGLAAALVWAAGSLRRTGPRTCP